MKEAIYLVAILLQVGVIIFFVRRNKARAGNKAEDREDYPEGSYEQQRGLALSVTSVQLNLTIPDSVTFVHGVVMDWNTGDTIVSLSAYITGAANLYLSNGGGVSGAGKKPEVGEAAVKFVAAAADHIHSAVPVAGIKDMPPVGCVRFYLLTNKQIFAAQEQVKHLDDGSSSWLDVFSKGNDVIAEMRN